MLNKLNELVKQVIMSGFICNKMKYGENREKQFIDKFHIKFLQI